MVAQLQGLDTLDDPTWAALTQLGRAVHAEHPDLQATLDTVLRVAAQAIEHADGASISLLAGGKLQGQATLGEIPQLLVAQQRQNGSGPCVATAHAQHVIRIPHTSAVRHWPEWAELAMSLQVASVLCVPMWLNDDVLGTMTLYASEPEAFDAAAERVAGLLSVHASVALSQARRRENLTAALHNRDVIGQAKGILMERHHLTGEAAFELLSKASQRSNRKLAAIAEELATTGGLTD